MGLLCLQSLLSRFYFLVLENKGLSQDLRALHHLINLYLWCRTAFWHDWFWSVEVRPIGRDESAVPVHLWVWVGARDPLTDPRALPALHPYPTSQSFSSGAAGGGGRGGAGHIRLAPAQAAEEEGSWGITAATTRLLSCCLILTVPRGWPFTKPFTNLSCCGAKWIFTAQHVCNSGGSWPTTCALMKVNHVLARLELIK